MVFPVVTYSCESWTIKKVECQRIEMPWSVVLEKTLESPLDGKILREISPECSVGRADAEAETPVIWSSDANS